MICGHIHHAVMHDLNGVRYVNTGDWVESCTAVIEHWTGELELIRFAEVLAQEAAQTRIPARPRVPEAA